MGNGGGSRTVGGSALTRTVASQRARTLDGRVAKPTPAEQLQRAHADLEAAVRSGERERIRQATAAWQKADRAETKASGNAPTKRGTASIHNLLPIRQFERSRTIDPFAPVDPRYLSQLYGHDKLSIALQPYTLDRLKQTAAVIEHQHPGTKPTSRASRDAVIAYIVEHTPDDGLANIPGTKLLI